jgi:hypothetical protein
LFAVLGLLRDTFDHGNQGLECDTLCGTAHAFSYVFCC